MVIKDANYYTTQHYLKVITLVDQDYSSRHGQKKRAEVWNLCKRLFEHPQNALLPEFHKKVKGLPGAVGARKSSSTAEALLLLLITFTQSLAKQTQRQQQKSHLVGGGIWTRRR